MVCNRLFFKGRVQGVCFRDKLRRIARELGATGWVRNRSDGRAECVVEGDVDEFVERAKKLGFPVRVDSVKKEEFPPQEFGEFSVKPTL